MNHRSIKFGTSLGLLLLTGYAGMTGNETILPSALLLLVLFLVSIFSARQAAKEGRSISGRAARAAITSYALFFATISLLVSLFLPAISTYFNLNGLYDGDFVRVYINDMHEFAYGACLLLLLNAIFLFLMGRKQPAALKG